MPDLEKLQDSGCHVLVHLQVLAADPLIVVGFGQGTAAEARADYQCKSQGQGLLWRYWTGLLRKRGEQGGTQATGFCDCENFWDSQW